MGFAAQPCCFSTFEKECLSVYGFKMCCASFSYVSVLGVWSVSSCFWWRCVKHRLSSWPGFTTSGLPSDKQDSAVIFQCHKCDSATSALLWPNHYLHTESLIIYSYVSKSHAKTTTTHCSEICVISVWVFIQSVGGKCPACRRSPFVPPQRGEIGAIYISEMPEFVG